ncbi:MAG: cell division protein SepF [Acidimicrobiales bacterium]
MTTLMHRAMVWLGITDDEDELDAPVYHQEPFEDPRPMRNPYEEEVSDPPSYARQERPARVQVISNPEPSVGRGDDRVTAALSKQLHDDDVVDLSEREPRTNPVIRPIRPEGPKVHLAIPTKFSDVKEIADHMKGGRPVIVNIEGLDKEVYRRIIDFCSGLTYALGGKVKKVAEQVYLLTPSKVELADEEMERISERAIFRSR